MTALSAGRSRAFTSHPHPRGDRGRRRPRQTDLGDPLRVGRGRIAGNLNETTQADYVVAGLERARAEWPWMGPLFQWGLIPGADLGGGTRLSEPCSVKMARRHPCSPSWAPLPCAAARARRRRGWRRGCPSTSGRATGTSSISAPTRTALRPKSRRDSASDSKDGVIARARLSREAGDVEVTIDGQPVDVSLESFQAEDVDIPLARRLPDGAHEVAMRLTAPGQLTVGGLVVERAVPMQWPILLLLLSGVALLFHWLDGALLIAERTGLLQRRSGELWPELPQIPDWRPPRRA